MLFRPSRLPSQPDDSQPRNQQTDPTTNLAPILTSQRVVRFKANISALQTGFWDMEYAYGKALEGVIQDGVGLGWPGAGGGGVGGGFCLFGWLGIGCPWAGFGIGFR